MDKYELFEELKTEKSDSVFDKETTALGGQDCVEFFLNNGKLIDETLFCRKDENCDYYEFRTTMGVYQLQVSKGENNYRLFACYTDSGAETITNISDARNELMQLLKPAIHAYLLSRKLSIKKIGVEQKARMKI